MGNVDKLVMWILLLTGQMSMTLLKPSNLPLATGKTALPVN